MLDPTPLLPRPNTAPVTPPVADTIHLGHYGSTAPVERVLRLAGRDAATVRLAAYDLSDPFWPLRTGELDAMVTQFPVYEPDLVVSRALTLDPRAVLVAADHPLARLRAVSVEDLADHPLPERPGLCPPALWDEFAPRHTPSGRPLRRGPHFASTTELLTLVRAGEAVHLTVLTATDPLPPGTRAVPVTDLRPAPTTLTWRRGDVPDHVLDFITSAEAGASL